MGFSFSDLLPWSPPARDHASGVLFNSVDPGHYFTPAPGVNRATQAGQAALDQAQLDNAAEIEKLRAIAKAIIDKEVAGTVPLMPVAIAAGIVLLSVPMLIRKARLRAARR